VEMNRRRKVRWIPETAGFALDAHDLAVEALSNTIRDRMFRESEHAVEMTLELRGDLLHRLEPRAHGPAIPVGEKRFLAAAWRFVHSVRRASLIAQARPTLRFSAWSVAKVSAWYSGRF